MVRLKFKPTGKIYRINVGDPDLAVKIAYTVLECSKQDIHVISYDNTNKRSVFYEEQL